MSGVELDLTAVVDQLVDLIVSRVVAEVTDQLATVLIGPAQPPPAVETLKPAVHDQLDNPVAVHGRNSHSRDQDAVKRTCEVCGRVGTRRYTATATGWKCSPTAHSCPGNKGQAAPDAESDIPAKEFQPNVPPTEPGPEGDIGSRNSTTDVTPPANNPPAAKPTRSADQFCVHCMQHHDDHDRDELACPIRGGFSTTRRFEGREVPRTPPVEPREAGGPTVTASCTECPRTYTLTGRVLRMAVDTHEVTKGHIVDVYEGGGV